MKLSEIKHGQRFAIKETGEVGLSIGLFGLGSNVVVMMDGSPRLTNYKASLEVVSQ